MAQSDKDKQPDVPPPRRNRTEAVSAQAGFVAATALARAGFADPTLVLRWEEIAGADVARIARPIRLSEGSAGGVLTLKAEPAASLFLQHQSRSLCDRINSYLGRNAIARLRFVQGPIAQRSQRPSVQIPKSQATAGDPARGFRGSEPLKAALLELAGARRRRTPD
jgi:hypothetical protein